MVPVEWQVCPWTCNFIVCKKRNVQSTINLLRLLLTDLGGWVWFWGDQERVCVAPVKKIDGQSGDIGVQPVESIERNNTIIQRLMDGTCASVYQLEFVGCGFLQGRKIVHQFAEDGPNRVLFACGEFQLGPQALYRDLVDTFGDKIFRFQNSVGWKNFRHEYHLCGIRAFSQIQVWLHRAVSSF
eukprot:GHVT01103915.1.p1 GENE.GHVT01103915.1~~GHVT01103915.1.p1  ORF type:complete len:184 (-),score=10.44 GHVT01103915.1:293-844(-)